MEFTDQAAGVRADREGTSPNPYLATELGAGRFRLQVRQVCHEAAKHHRQWLLGPTADGLSQHVGGRAA